MVINFITRWGLHGCVRAYGHVHSAPLYVHSMKRSSNLMKTYPLFEVCVSSADYVSEHTYIKLIV